MERIHFIGIGGYSMSGLALFLKRQGYLVTGSDMNMSTRVRRLLDAGIVVHIGHSADNVDGANRVIYNTDISEDNVERKAAREQNIAQFHRSHLLAEILEAYQTIAISGTHGKTTTTTMVGTVLVETRQDPTVFVGGEVSMFDGNVRIGRGDWAVVEADESDGTFLRYDPMIAVATNVEAEHLDHFGGQFENVRQAFFDFLQKVPAHGLAVVCMDNMELRNISDRLTVPFMTYGLNFPADFMAIDLKKTEAGTEFSVVYRGEFQGRGLLKVPGVHNVSNALAALAVAHHLNVPWEESLGALEHFRNANRRFQRLLEGRILIVDDYAHHPTEISSTLQAAQQVTHGRVMAMFQPQRYVRTQALWDQFLGCFEKADVLFLTDIYAPPGEKPIPGVSSERLAQEIRDHHPELEVQYFSKMYDAIPAIVEILRPGDTFITMGAGNINLVAEQVREALIKND